MGPRGLMLGDESVLSSGYQSPVYRESSASYPPLGTMQQQFNPNTLQMQLQSLQMQLQLQSANGQASQPQQPRTSAFGNSPLMPALPKSISGLTEGGPSPTQVLLVLTDPSMGAIFRQALSQAPIPSVLYLASTVDMWTVIDQLKKATGRPSGPDIVFFQPEVLMANPGTVLRLKQACGGSCPAVVLQGSEPIARALQADDFLAAPTPAHPLRKDDLALMILKWCSRQQNRGSNSTLSNALSAGGTSVSSVLTGLGTSGVSSMPAVSPSGGFSALQSGSGAAVAAAVLPSGASSPKSAQVLQLQALQAQLQALQQAKQEQKARSSNVAPPSQRNSSEIEPVSTVGPLSMSAATASTHAFPQRRPPPLRLASAGVVPSDSYPDIERNLARASTPVTNGSSSARGLSVADVSELVAQVAELRRKLGDKSRAISMRSPTGSGAGGTALSPTGSLSGNFVSGGTASGGAFSGMLSSGGSLASGATLMHTLSQPTPSFSPADLQLQLQSLQAKQQALLQRMAGGGGGNSSDTAQAAAGGPSAAVSVVPGLGSSSAAPPTSMNRTRQPTAGRPSLQGFGSLSRSGGDDAADTFTPFKATQLPPSQFSSLQLQQQLLQLQQLQLQLQQQQQQQQRLVLTPSSGLGSATGANLSLDSLPPGSRLPNTSPTGSLTSNLGNPLPSPGSGAGALQNNMGSDSGSVSRSNSFVAAGGTRYRPPRQRTPSPLSGASGPASGHVSDTYPGASTLRFASPQFRSGSGSGAVGAASGSAGRRGVGNSSGHTSDSGTSPDVGIKVRGGNAALISKSGDDAIAAALNAASGDADTEKDSPMGSPASAPASTSTNATAAGPPHALNDALRSLDGAGDGGSSTDGRSLMDASFVLDGSGAGGRGSISGGAASSVDLQPSRSTLAAAAPPPPPDLPSEEGSQSPLQPRSNLGGTRVGSHRLSSSTINFEASEEDDQPLRASAARQPTQAAVVAPLISAAATVASPVHVPNGPSLEPTPAAASTVSASAAPVEKVGKAADAAEKLVQALVAAPAATEALPSPQRTESSTARGKAAMTSPDSGALESSQVQGSPAAATGSRAVATIMDGDSVRAASPDSIASQRHIRPSPPPPGTQQHSPSSSKASARVSGSGAIVDSALADQSVESKVGDRLPSIDGSQPLTAAATRSGGGGGNAAGFVSSSSSSLRREASARSAGSVGRRAVMASTSDVAAGVASDLPQSTDTNGTGGTTAEPQNQSLSESSRPATHRSNDGGSLVASIEGSITAGLPRTGSRGSADAAQRSPGTGEVQLRSTASRGRSGAIGGYTDDIFSSLQVHERREVFSPVPLTSGTQQQQLLQPPPRPATPPARRTARILLCSHPIVITREDFLPF